MSCIHFSFPGGGSGEMCGFPDDRGRFLFWTWELHNYTGVSWYWMQDTRFERPVYPGEHSLLWLIFYAQHKEK